jgi:hypothetical protein
VGHGARADEVHAPAAMATGVAWSLPLAAHGVVAWRVGDPSDLAVAVTLGCVVVALAGLRVRSRGAVPRSVGVVVAVVAALSVYLATGFALRAPLLLVLAWFAAGDVAAVSAVRSWSAAAIFAAGCAQTLVVLSLPLGEDLRLVAVVLSVTGFVYASVPAPSSSLRAWLVVTALGVVVLASDALLLLPSGPSLAPLLLLLAGLTVLVLVAAEHRSRMSP